MDARRDKEEKFCYINKFQLREKAHVKLVEGEF